MMSSIAKYFLCVAAASVVCAAVNSLVNDKGTYAAILKILCGIFLTVTVLSPWADLKIDNFRILPDGIREEAQSAVNAGKESTANAQKEIIKTKTEAYILDKATSLGIEAAVEVTLSSSDPPVPASVTICGSASPYAKARLRQYMTAELAIPEENQIWK